MEKMKEKEEIKGCLILSTCNRMEVWVSLSEGAGLQLPDYICELKGMDKAYYRKFLKVREKEEAVRHLFFLSAGMKSQIMGEDQILSQVKEAVAFAREQECMDHVLEVLFRMAVTAGKQVKTSVHMDKSNFSAAHQAISMLKEKGNTIKGKKALVIGNGEMGKITAQALMEEGADVTVTVRQYRSGVVNIPHGARRMNYGERYAYIPQCDFIFSATASPNLTITRKDLEACGVLKPQIYVDLAVPRDIEESLSDMEHILLYDMDSLSIEKESERMKEQFRQAEEILESYIRDFYEWQESRDLIPRIQQIGAACGQEFCWRTEREIKNLGLSAEEKEALQSRLSQTAGKIVDRLLFALRDELDTDTLHQCVAVLEQLWEEKQ